MRKANYDRFPSTKISGTVIQGWENICSLLEEHLKAYPALAVDFYTGVYAVSYTHLTLPTIRLV